MDIPLLIRSDNSSSERRISPAWSLAHLKSRLEPITGVPAACQRLSLTVASQPALSLDVADEDAVQIGAWPLQAYAELQVGALHRSCLIPSYITPFYPYNNRYGNKSVQQQIRTTINRRGTMLTDDPGHRHPPSRRPDQLHRRVVGRKV